MSIKNFQIAILEKIILDHDNENITDSLNLKKKITDPSKYIDFIRHGLIDFDSGSVKLTNLELRALLKRLKTDFLKNYLK